MLVQLLPAVPATVQLSPLVPETVHEETFDTFQCTEAVVPRGTMEGSAVR